MVKRIYLILIFAAMVIPTVQQVFQLYKEEPLTGITSTAEKVPFTKENYWNLKWQEGLNAYVNDHFGSRPDFVRAYNQILLSVFNVSNAPGVVVGKDEQLFIESYIDDYIGRNYIGHDKIEETVDNLRSLQDSLKTIGTDLIVVFAPGKASFYPEFIPDQYLSKKKEVTNYSDYRKSFTEKGVNFIDLNQFFKEKKSDFKYNVYSKYGTHWNHYGMMVALDTIVSYIEHKREINLPDINYDQVKMSSDLKGNDFDIGVLVNTTFGITKDNNPYPVINIDKGEQYSKPDVLIVGDSYWWCLVGDNIPGKIFKTDEYWFYNKDQYIDNGKRNEVSKLDLFETTSNRDVIVLIATEATFYMFPYGFADNVMKVYCESHDGAIQKELDRLKADPASVERIVASAKENKRTTEQEFKREAYKAFYGKDNGLTQMMDNIRKDSVWMSHISEKAKANNISVEEQLRLDAIWTLEHK